jgi:hypothetical protein
VNALLRLAYFLLDRTVLARPYVCEDCPRLRRSLTAAQFRRWLEDYVVLCRCGQRMAPAQHPTFGDFRPKVST